MVLKELWTWNQPCFLTLFPHPVAENLFSARLEDFRHKILSLTVTPWIYIQCWEIVIKLLSYLNSKKKHAFTRKFCKFRKLIIWLIGHLENWPRPVDIYHVFSVFIAHVFRQFSYIFTCNKTYSGCVLLFQPINKRILCFLLFELLKGRKVKHKILL